MIAKILPLALALTGLGAGVGAGIALRAAPEAHPSAGLPDAVTCGDTAPAAKPLAAKVDTHGNAETDDFVKLANQFVVPVISDGAIASMVVLALSLQVAPGSSDTVFSREPILRDRMLRVMLDHANAGGFSGAFTGTRRMDDLRRALIEAARPILGDVLNDVLITEIARQDI